MKMNSFPSEKQDRIKAILCRYARGEIGLDQAYYELLDDDLIAMPQRCAVFARVPLSQEDESRLKEKIRAIIS
ncbi:MAG TPA: hypothetical protein PKV28_09900 [Methanothrix sp.]|nr:hypothetical protein [Methanothrix sp.]